MGADDGEGIRGLVNRFFESLRLQGVKYTTYMTLVKITSMLNIRKWYMKRVSEIDMSDLPNDVISFGISIHGGMGDCIVSANYLQRLVDRFGAEKFRIFLIAHNNYGSVRSVFDGNPLVHSISRPTDVFSIKNDFDVFINLSRYPDLLFADYDKVASVCPEFLDYLVLCSRFKTEYGSYLDYVPFLDGQSAAISVIMGKKRINQPDIYGFLGIGEEYDYDIKIPDEEAVLEKFGLSGKEFIAVHRGCDNVQNDRSVKMWPLDHYDRLIGLMRERLPDAFIIQFGSPMDVKINAELDENLVGKTTMDEMKVIVKRCKLLVDNEGGTVHLRHALHGGISIVMFGSTSPEFYGYSENVNIRSGCCPIACEWTINQWQDGCLRGTDPAPCMAGITPEQVVDEIVKAMGGDNE